MSNTPGQGDGMDGGSNDPVSVVGMAKSAIAEVVSTLLYDRTEIDFIHLDEKQKPKRTERFRNLDIEVGSNGCDAFILTDKAVLELLKDPLSQDHVIVAKRIWLTEGDRKKYSAWRLRITGWWVPHGVVE